MTDSLLQLAKIAGIKEQSATRWEELSASVIAARLGGMPTAVDKELEKESSALDGHLLSIAYKGWIAFNQMEIGQYVRAVKLYDKLVVESETHRKGPLPFDPALTLLRHRVDALRMMRSAKSAIQGAIDLSNAASAPHPAFALEVARTAEGFGEYGIAEKWYKQTIAITTKKRGQHYRARSTVEGTSAFYREVAIRDLERLRREPDMLQTPEVLAQGIADAISERDYKKLARYASRTHFNVTFGCHSVYVGADETSERLIKVLGSAFAGPFELIYRGAHCQLSVGHFKVGNALQPLKLILRKWVRGWEWTGIVAHDSDYWVPDFPRAPKETNQPLSIRIVGPWQSGKKFMAGGFRHPWHGLAALGDIDPISRTIRACSSECGFGLRGFYYNEAISHNGHEAFAIDFTSYEQCNPYASPIDRWPVLAPADGLVVGVESSIPDGSDRGSNTVELIHPAGTPPCKYLSRYLHLARTPIIPVSEGMFLRRGAALGFMDDTGNSAMPHLHFSIHDQSMGPHRNMVTSSVSAPIMFGPSVRATPMAGQRLDDADDGRCVDSRNAGVLPTVRVSRPGGP